MLSRQYSGDSRQLPLPLSILSDTGTVFLFFSSAARLKTRLLLYLFFSIVKTLETSVLN